MNFLGAKKITVSLKLIGPVLLDRWSIVGITILCHHRVNHQLFRDGTLQRLPSRTRGFFLEIRITCVNYTPENDHMTLEHHHFQ